MATQFEIYCALMAGDSYISNRPDKNRFPIPNGWTTVPGSYVRDDSSGFEAVSFTNGNQIVISFAGTDSKSAADLAADIGLATGWGSEQLLQAAAYYMEVKAANPNAEITFTGHSLGGGLAALMGVFFDKTAVTFDQAPFFAAATESIRNGIKEYLLGLKDKNQQSLYTLTTLQTLAPDLFSFTDSAVGDRVSKISGKYVQGEALTSSYPYNGFTALGDQVSLVHGPTTVDPWDLHSQALLTTFLLDDRFRQVTYQLTDLLGMLFDSRLYANPTNENKENFLDRLVRHQIGNAPGVTTADNMLTRFTDDLKKITDQGDLSTTNEDIIKALTAFAMQMYYDGPNATNKDKELFDTTGITGGLHFDRSDVAADLNKAKGFDCYFRNYLNFMPGAEINLSALEAIKKELPQLLDWYIQVGSSPMTATAGSQRAFMLGGNGADNLTGGSADDVLMGGKGADQLNGGAGNDTLIGNSGNDSIWGSDGDDVLYGDAGNDTLIGGAGKDTYIYTVGDGNDTIIDTGANEIKIYDLAGHLIQSDVFYKKDANTWMNTSGKVKIIQNKIILEDGSQITLQDANIVGGDFGINLITIPDNPTATNTIYQDVVDSEHVNHQGVPNYGTLANDNIIGGAGNDWVGNWSIAGLYGGDDWIVGGAGNDILNSASPSGNDILEGDSGIDVLFGNSGSNKIYCDSTGEMDQMITAGETAQSLSDTGDIASGGDGDDFIYGSNAKDALFGGLGNDLIVGGGGDDFIYSDAYAYGVNVEQSLTVRLENSYAGFVDWSYTVQRNAAGNIVTSLNNVYVDQDSYNNVGDDVIYAGTGNDFVSAGYGDDEIYGGIGNDTIFGDAGNDFIEGGDGDDVLIGDDGTAVGDDYIDGGNGNDYLEGQGGNDELFGGADNDKIYGDEGDDYLDGESGTDSLYGGAGDDVMFGGDDADYMEGDNYDLAGNDYLDGEDGNDTIIGAGGSDTIFGGADNDQLHGDASDVALADQGDDYIDGEGGDNLLVGYGGNDTLIAAEGNDTLSGDAGDDYIDAGDGTNIIYAGADNDEIYSGTGNDYIEGGTGNDYIDAGDGDNIILGLEDDDTIYAGTGNDWIQGDAGNDCLDGGAGNNTLLGGDGNDTLFGDDGDDNVQGDGGNDYLDGGTGDDYMMGMDGLDTINGGDDNDSVWGGAGNDTIYGDAGNDQLAGEAGDDYLDGGLGDDLLVGGEGNDTIYGGIGNDYLQGDAGSDAYIFGRGDGVVTISNYADDYATATDTVQFGAGITAADLLLVRDANDLRINIVGTTDSLTINNWFSGDAYKLDQFIFADSTIMTAIQIDTLYASTNIYGTAGDDDLYGYATNDYIEGGGGNDTINGGAGADSLYGGSGSDTYYFDRGYGQDIIVDTNEGVDNINQIQMAPGISPNEINGQRVNNDLKLSIIGTDDNVLIKDWYSLNEYSIKRIVFYDGTEWDTDMFWDADAVIYGTDENDEIYGGIGNDTIYGKQGNDWLRGLDGNDKLYGGEGDDRLKDYEGVNVMDGGPGDDWLSGVGGENTYMFNKGDGNDRIFSHPLYNKENELHVGKDTIIFGEGITPDNITVGSTIATSVYYGWGSHELSIDIGNGEGVTVSSFYPEEHPQQGYPDNITDFGVTRFIFSDGSVLNLEDMLSLSTFSYGSGSANEVCIMGTSSEDVIVGGNENDRIYTLDGNDIINAGGSYDLISGGAGNDTIHAGEGCDVLIGGSGDDNLYGEADNDMIMSGKGNDLMAGGDGDDNYIYYRGDGADTIQDVSTSLEGNSLLFGDIYYEDIQGKLEVYDNEAIIRIGDGDEIHLTGIDPETGLQTSHVIDVIGFADGKIMTYQDILDGNNPVIRGTEGDDILEGSSLDNIMDGYDGNDTLYGYAGNDTIYGGDGDDTIYGGRGNDVLYGGSGNNTYYFIPGDGTDTVYGNDGVVYAANNTIVFGKGITPDMIRLKRGSLLIEVGDNGDSIRIPDFNPEDARANPVINTFVFADGTTLTYDELIDKGFDIDGTISDDILTGTNVVDRINAMEGNDSISSGAGDDVITGGVGNDELLGGSGSDTYVFHLGDGVDTITDTSTVNENNMILFGEGITKDDLTFTRNNGFLTINVGNNGDAINLLNFDQDEIEGSLVVRTLEFADGTQMNLTDFLNRAPVAANPIESQAAMEDAVFSFTIPGNTFVDPDSGDTLTYSATLADGTVLPSWLIFDPATMTFSGTPTNDDVGTLSLKVTATDLAGASVSSSFNIDVANVNDAPVVVTPLTGQTATEDSEFTYIIPAGTFNDVDADDILTYSATLADGTVLPSWLIFDPATMTFSGIPFNDDIGELSLKVTATDTSGVSASSDFNVTVQPVVNYGTNHTDLIITGSKRDFINALGGSDIVYTGEGNDTIYGGDGTDLLCGDGGNDVIFGENDTDILLGGNGDDTLDGGADGDIMLGGDGDDTYMVDNARDIVTEYHNGGTDAVWSSVTYTIGSNIENLTLTGTAAINGTGNNFDNILTGNGSANTLTGDKGDDTLSGGAGNDTLDGGKGSDTYLFSRTDGLDTIIDTKKTNTDTDTLKLAGDITTTEPVIVKQNNDLYVFINSDNYMKIVNEFQQTNYGIERLEVSDGHYITRADIETIVDTMSAINNDSGMDVMQKYNAMMVDQTYQNILAQSWQ